MQTPAQHRTELVAELHAAANWHENNGPFSSDAKLMRRAVSYIESTATADALLQELAETAQLVLHPMHTHDTRAKLVKLINQARAAQPKDGL